MKFQLDKKMKIYIGAGVVGLVIIVFFTVLLLGNGDKKNAEVMINKPIQQVQQTQTSAPDQLEQTQTAIPEKQTQKSNESTKSTVSALQDAPYTKVFFDGKTHVISPGDMVIDSQGNLLIKANFLGAGLGIPVSWEKDSVWVGLQPVKGTEEVAQYVSDLDYLRFYIPENQTMGKLELSKDQWDKQTNFAIAGTEYSKGMGLNLSYGWGGNIPVSLDYNTAGKYKNLKAEVGIDDAYRNFAERYILRVYGDNSKKLFESKEFRGGDFALPVDVDITGVIRLTIEVTRVSDNNQNNDAKIVIANARLTK